MGGQRDDNAGPANKLSTSDGRDGSSRAQLHRLSRNFLAASAENGSRRYDRSNNDYSLETPHNILSIKKGWLMPRLRLSLHTESRKAGAWTVPRLLGMMRESHILAMTCRETCVMTCRHRASADDVEASR